MGYTTFPMVICMNRMLKNETKLKIIFSGIVVGLFATASAMAQTAGTAGIEGFVTDADGKPLAGAFVELTTIVRPDGTVATTGVFTDANGFYVMEVPVGSTTVGNTL